MGKTARWKLNTEKNASIKRGFYIMVQRLNIRNPDGSKPRIGPDNYEVVDIPPSRKH